MQVIQNRRIPPFLYNLTILTRFKQIYLEMEFKEISGGIYTISNFMSSKESAGWIKFSEEKGYEEAKITMGQQQVMAKSVRNNERLIYDDVDLERKLWNRIKDYVPKETMYGRAMGLNERFRFYKYYPGQQFKPHQDGSYIRNIHEWSSYTFMIYLNEEMKGGATKFSTCEIVPETGMALIFRHELIHEGCPVLAGVKYVLRTDVMYKRKVK